MATPTAHTNLDGYDAPPIEWDHVARQLRTNLPQAPGDGGPNRHTAWLTTPGPDGAPHVRPLGIVSVNEVWYFNSSLDTRKSHHLADDPHCVVNVATEPFDV